MAFDPDAYLAKKSAPAFDPDAYLASKGESPAPSEGGSTLDKIAEIGKGFVTSAAKTALPGAGTAIDMLSNPKETIENAPTIGGFVGGLTAGPVGAGIGATGGEILKQAGEAAMTGESKNPLDAIAEMGKAGAVAAAGEGVAGLAAKGAAKAATLFARRSLGITKGIMNNTKSFRESLRLQARAGKAGESMLEEGAIPLLGGAEKTKANVMKVLNKAGAEMNAVRDSLKGKTINVDDLGGKILDEIKTDFPGQNKVGLEILNDLESVRGKVDINKLQELKSRFAKLGYVDRTVGTDASLAYRKAADTLDRYMNDFIEANASKEAAVRFQSAKKLYGNASFAMKGVSQDVAAELGNNLFSLPSYILAGAELAGGNPLKAASTVGIIQAIRNRGSAVTANTLKGVSKVPKGTGAGLSDILRRSKEKK